MNRMQSFSGVTYDHILRFGLLVQNVRGTTLQFDTRHLQETLPLPNDIHLIKVFARLRKEALRTPLQKYEIVKPSVLFRAPGLDISVDIANDDRPEAGGVSFGVVVTPSSDILKEAQILNKKDKVEEYRVFADHQTSFVWTVRDGYQDMVEDLSTTFTPSLAKSIENWTDVYDDNFEAKLVEYGGALEVFPTVAEVAVWSLEGAMLAISMASVTSTPVLYSAYLSRKYRFVGDSVKDAATLIDLVLELNKVVGPADPQYFGILGLSLGET